MKIGIVGHGSIGSRHAKNARDLGHDVIVYDPAGAFMRAGKTVKFERQIYEEADAIIVATPSPYHEGPLRAAVEHGKHVLVEKPISTSLGMLAPLLRVAEDNDLVVMMGNNLRFHPCVQQTKNWLSEIGPIWALFICGTTAKPSGLADGVAFNVGSHEVDLALHFFGPGEVISASGRWGINGPDEIIDFVIRHDTGVRSSFHLDLVTTNEIRECTIGGTKGNIRIWLPGRMASMTNKFRQFPGSYDDDYVDELREFVARIAGDSSGPGATGRDGLATLKLLIDAKVKAAFPA